MNTVGISYKQSPVEIREKLVLSKQEQVYLLRRLVARFPIDEIFILSTCNRTEIYYYSSSSAKKIPAKEIFSELLLLKEIAQEEFPFFEKEKEKAYQHFFRVSSGLESMILGETQILKQIKEARMIAKEQNLFGPQLERLFQKMLYTVKKIRTETKISANAVSVGSTAARLAKTIFDDLSKRKIMVIGAGETAELILQHLITNGASKIIITNRTFENALRLAKKFRGSAIWYENRYHHLEEMDIVISSTSSQDLVIKKSLYENSPKRKSPIFFIDVAIPRNIDPEIAKFTNCYLYHIDDLQEVIDFNYDLRKKESTKVEEIIEEELENFSQLLSWKKQSYLIKTLKTQQEKILEKELESFFTKHSYSSKDQEIIIQMANRINKKLSHNPYLFLKKKCSNEVKIIFSDIFGLQFVKNKELEKPNNIIKFNQKKNEQKI